MTTTTAQPIRVLIIGAGGRDFHNFNTVFRDDPRYVVTAFTATQIPGIANRTYPASLAGPLYPNGIPIYDQARLDSLIVELAVEQVVFAYSDISHSALMDLASRVMAKGPDWRLLGPAATQLVSRRPIVAVTAVRTGAGKSQTTRALVKALSDMGRRAVVVRHPMPYGDLAVQAVQRFARYDDLVAHRVTIEEREEYEPHLEHGIVVFAGVDYARILEAAEAEADVVVWDGGNNDFPFYRPDLNIVVVDPLRAGHETAYYPGAVNLRQAQVAIINKVDSASSEQVALVEANIREANPGADILRAESRIKVADPGAIRGRKVVIVEDGPTLTHGEMAFGAGHVAATRLGAAEIVDPRPYAVRSIAATYEQYPATGPILPAMGYSEAQVADLAETLARVPAELIIVGTPIDLGRLVTLNKPAVHVGYELALLDGRSMAEVLARHLPAS